MAYAAQITHDPTTTSYWATQSFVFGTTVTEQPTSTLGADRVSIRWSRTTPVGTREDDVFISFALAKIVGGGLYSPLTLPELATAETALSAYCTSMAVDMSSAYTCVEFIWHELRASHSKTAKGSEAIGPAIKRTAKSIAGGVVNSRQPDQVSATTTIRTASRKHWGRVYIPGMAANGNDTTYGRITNTRVDDLATLMRTLQASWDASSFQLGIWTFAYKAFMPLTEIRADNVWDIIRRRRAKQSNYFKSFTS